MQPYQSHSFIVEQISFSSCDHVALKRRRRRPLSADSCSRVAGPLSVSSAPPWVTLLPFPFGFVAFPPWHYITVINNLWLCVCVHITVSPAPLRTSPPPPDLPPAVHHSLYQCSNRVSSFQKPSPAAGLPVGAGEPGYRWRLKYLVRANRVRPLLLSGPKGWEIDPAVDNLTEVQYLAATHTSELGSGNELMARTETHIVVGECF